MGVDKCAGEVLRPNVGSFWNYRRPTQPRILPLHRTIIVKLRSRSSPGHFLDHSRSILSHSNLFQFKIRWSGPGADAIFTVSAHTHPTNFNIQGRFREGLGKVQGKYILNLPWTFPEPSLNLCWMLPEPSTNLPFLSVMEIQQINAMVSFYIDPPI